MASIVIPSPSNVRQPVSKMAGVGFRWLDILEKEFDKAFVDLDVAIGKFWNLIMYIINLLLVIELETGNFFYKFTHYS